jgi:pyridinium-3,5-biscarboxylic acid mononucleotide synthase
LEEKRYKVLKRQFKDLRYFKAARIAFYGEPASPRHGNVLILTAGTSDIPIAQEAAVFLELLGNKVEQVYDVGAAGLHRLDPFIDKIKSAKVIIVVAGMEAALLTIVTGISPAPVIGVPTSVGYGASFEGLAALLGMINACPLGSSVVNIDNGIGAGYMAHLINKE